MKKILRALALVLALTMLLCGSAFAANDAPDITVADGTVATFTFDSAEAKLTDVTYKNDTIVPGGEYMVRVIKEVGGAYLATESTILYMDQVQATENGAVTFENVFLTRKIEDEIVNCAVVISGTDLEEEVEAIYVKWPYVLGDADGSGAMDVGDATLLLRYLAYIADESDINLLASDVDGSGSVDVGDATKMLRVLAKLDTL